MRKNFCYYQNMIAECYRIHNMPYQEVSEEELKHNLSLVDEYTDIVTDTFLTYGLKEDWEPNKYGLELEETIDFLLKIRYSIVG